LTAATVREYAVNPFPVQRTVTLTFCSQAQQKKSRITCNSVTDVAPQTRFDRRLRRKGVAPPSSIAARKHQLAPFALGAVLGTGLFAVGHALRVEHTTDDVVAYARQVADATAADKHDRVLLEVVSFPRDVRGYLNAVGQADAGHLAQGR